MKFNTHEERNEAVKVATEELGKAVGELKYKEFLVSEAIKSYVPDAPYRAPESKPEPAKKAPAKKAPAKKPVAKKAPVEKEAPTEEATETYVEEATEAPVDDSDSEALTTEDLREYMTQRYNDGGKTPAVMKQLRDALEAATGCKQVAELQDSQIGQAYEAISKVEL